MTVSGKAGKKASKARKNRPAEAGQEPATAQRIAQARSERAWAAFRDRLAGLAWEPALRFASTADAAPARCPRRACQIAGACRLSTRGAPPLACGGGLSDETMARAAEHVVFACATAELVVAEFVEALPGVIGGLIDLMPEIREAQAKLKEAGVI